jgi:hypothetical protein
MVVERELGVEDLGVEDLAAEGPEERDLEAVDSVVERDLEAEGSGVAETEGLGGLEVEDQVGLVDLVGVLEVLEGILEVVEGVSEEVWVKGETGDRLVLMGNPVEGRIPGEEEPD